ncbi:MAG: universal stress protein [Hyphomicrobiaceae bacterium]|nr:MAG: universal stress protein [Hyphomicrobiaceae bacterium]
MKTMLVPCEHFDALDSTLICAYLFASRFGCHIEGVALRPSFAEFVAVDPISAASLPPVDWPNEESLRKTRAVFDGFMTRKGVPIAGAERKGAGFAWSDQEPMTDGDLASHARAFDIVVTSRPGSGEHATRMSTLEAILFESGRPTLIAPPKTVNELGRNVLIAWNSSTETARTIAFAMPVLEKAERVTVLSVEGGMVPGPSGEELARNLAANGVPVTVLNVKPGRQTTGEAILANTTALGCDLIIKGAYTQSRLRQWIFGGATSHLLASAELPIFMAH